MKQANMHVMIRRLLRKLGIDFSYAIVGKNLYGAIQTEANYSPWNADAAFLECYRRIQNYTMVDRFRLWELWDSVRQLTRVKGDILDGGTWRGGSGVLMGVAARLSGHTEPVWLCDTFTGIPRSSERDPNYKGGEHSDCSADNVRKLAKTMNTSVSLLEGIYPDVTGEKGPQVIKLAHIDVDVYESVKKVFEYIWPRMVPGGMVLFDDYGFMGADGVRQYVDETIKFNAATVVYNLNGHAVLVKTQAE
jgi:O-methyltransferase